MIFAVGLLIAALAVVFFIIVACLDNFFDVVITDDLPMFIVAVALIGVAMMAVSALYSLTQWAWVHML